MTGLLHFVCRWHCRWLLYSFDKRFLSFRLLHILFHKGKTIVAEHDVVFGRGDMQNFFQQAISGFCAAVLLAAVTS